MVKLRRQGRCLAFGTWQFSLHLAQCITGLTHPSTWRHIFSLLVLSKKHIFCWKNIALWWIKNMRAILPLKFFWKRTGQSKWKWAMRQHGIKKSKGSSKSIHGLLELKGFLLFLLQPGWRRARGAVWCLFEIWKSTPKIFSYSIWSGNLRPRRACCIPYKHIITTLIVKCHFFKAIIVCGSNEKPRTGCLLHQIW